MMKPVQLKTKCCPKCNKHKRANHFARHVRRCRGTAPLSKAVLLLLREDTVPVGKYNSVQQGQEELLQSLRLSLQEAKNKVISLETDNRILKDEKAKLAVIVIKEKDDRIAIKEQLTQTKEKLFQTHKLFTKRLTRTKALLAKKELEFTRRLANSKTTTVHNHNNHYHQYAINMTPWCIDPTHPSYTRFLERDVKEMREAMSVLPPRISVRDGFEMELDTKNRQTIFSRVVKHNLNISNPKFVVVDTARNKGMFVMPDHTVRMDPGMIMMLNHQFTIGVKLAITACDWWFLTSATMREFRKMITHSAGNGATRLKQLNPDDIPIHRPN